MSTHRHLGCGLTAACPGKSTSVQAEFFKIFSLVPSKVGLNATLCRARFERRIDSDLIFAHIHIGEAPVNNVGRAKAVDVYRDIASDDATEPAMVTPPKDYCLRIICHNACACYAGDLLISIQHNVPIRVPLVSTNKSPPVV
ncbi:hypothetical protein PCANC_11803 [Puccinia coronata f. sp. avenae]|uniref:Uncharacterized protein n=1 Tax=Puccinia coronata f. sp. avenae TaxID=200324 RepID=A0A2N5SV93_9BASI|nr:hypothetical protein PCANC_11803 [Puccinia coronata f. sp. avenae]